MSTAKVLTPYPREVSQSVWEEAYQHACERIYEREGEEREPTEDEIEYSLEVLEEQWNEEARMERLTYG